MRHSHDLVEQAARDMVARHGPSARGLAQERAALLERAGRWREHATALRLLTAVERMLDGGA